MEQNRNRAVAWSRFDIALIDSEPCQIVAFVQAFDINGVKVEMILSGGGA